MNIRTVSMMAILLLVVIVGLNSVFVVTEREMAILFKLQEFDRSDYKPGIYFKLPIYHSVEKYDKRILTHDASNQRYLTKEGNPLIIDYYVKWRISDVETYYKKMKGSEIQAVNRFNSIVNQDLSDAIGTRDEWQVISADRGKIMDAITIKAREQVKEFGIYIVDVRTKRIELPPKTFERIFDRMRSDRIKEANERRATGKGEGDRIRAEAEKERKIMLAEGYNEAQHIRGEGDAKAIEIYASAYNKNPEFYSFYRKLEAYRKSFNSQGDILVIDPNSDFFEYFKQTKPKK